MEKRKRRALTEITNTGNLIPTSLLRKLVKPPISTSSSTNPNFYSQNNNNNRSQACSNSSISSNHVSDSRTLHFNTPPISPGDVVSKDAGQYKLLNVGKAADKLINSDVVITRHTPVEKKDKGKAIAATLFTPRPIKAKDSENASTNLSSSLEATKQKRKADLFILDETAQNVKKSVKGFSNPSRCSSNEKPDKGKAISIPSVPLVFDTENMKGFEKTYSRSGSKTVSKKKDSLRPSGIFTRESRKVGSDLLLKSSKSAGDRTKDKDKVLSNFGSLLKETKDNGKAIIHSTCPPKPRHMDYDGHGNTEPLKSWTDPHPARKKRCYKEEEFTELPREYIEQQNAYFKEVDSFELLVEEVSEDELEQTEVLDNEVKTI